MKKIELTVEEIEHSAIPGELLPMRPAHLDCIHRNINRLIAKKQSACSQVEWFKLSDKRPMNDQWIIYIDKSIFNPITLKYFNHWGHANDYEIWWTPCPTPPEFDSPCVKELKQILRDDYGWKNDKSDVINKVIEIVKRHEKKEKE